VRTTVRQLLDGGPTISVGMLTADLLRLGEDLALLGRAGGTVVHIDVMDGVFCPQLTLGPPIVKAIPNSFVKDCHLMITEPLDKVQSFVEAGADIITCHVESTIHPHRVLQSLAGTGVIRGIALNPGTPLEVLEPLLDECELVFLLAVNPGWGGQKFLPGTEARLARARRMIGDREILLEVDGGITRANIEHVATLGADLIVSGSAIYDGKDPEENARYMLDAVKKAHAGVSP